MGELDHPESSVVNLQNVSHNVKKMHFEGDNLLGEVEVLPTPSGNILKELFKAGIKLGISSRGMGSVETVNENGGEAQEVQPDFELMHLTLFPIHQHTENVYVSSKRVC